MHNKKKLKFLLYFWILILLYSCSSDDHSPDCGCKAETRSSIPESAPLTGKLFYKNTPDDPYYNKKYWLVYIEEDCSNCVHSMIVCNEDLLSKLPEIPSFSNINVGIMFEPDLEDALDVEFSGELKSACDKIISLGDYTYENFIINTIQSK